MFNDADCVRKYMRSRYDFLRKIALITSINFATCVNEITFMEPKVRVYSNI